MNEHEQDAVKQSVRESYARVVQGSSGCGCTPAAGAAEACCAPAVGPSTAMPAGADLGLSSGDPVSVAALQPGETVLDLGSGAGRDAFPAARLVGSGGLVIGVDMTPEMVHRARQLAREGAFENVSFRLGEIEHLPVADASVDVVISNCVINLAPDKASVYREALRVLKPGGRLAVSDMVAVRPLPVELRADPVRWSACIAGAEMPNVLERLLREAGFEQVSIETQRITTRDTPDETSRWVAPAMIRAVKPVT